MIPFCLYDIWANFKPEIKSTFYYTKNHDGFQGFFEYFENFRDVKNSQISDYFFVKYVYFFKSIEKQYEKCYN